MSSISIDATERVGYASQPRGAAVPQRGERRRRDETRHRDSGKPNNPKFNPGEAFAEHRISLIALAAVVLIVVALYSPLRDFYCAWRNNQIVLAQKLALDASNESTLSNIERLQTEEGIKDEARKRGYVEEGETLLEVTGLDEIDSTSDQDSSGSSSSDDATTVDEPWFVPVADVVFSYTPSEE